MAHTVPMLCHGQRHSIKGQGECGCGHLLVSCLHAQCPFSGLTGQDARRRIGVQLLQGLHTCDNQRVWVSPAGLQLSRPAGRWLSGPLEAGKVHGCLCGQHHKTPQLVATQSCCPLCINERGHSFGHQQSWCKHFQITFAELCFQATQWRDLCPVGHRGCRDRHYCYCCCRCSQMCNTDHPCKPDPASDTRYVTNKQTIWHNRMRRA